MRRRLSRFLPAGAMLGLVLLQGCQHLPSLQTRVPSTALPPAEGSRLTEAVAGPLQAHPGLSGVVTIENGRDAFAARAVLAEAAERSLDVQYYIWHQDMSGSLLFTALRRAADRGVRVRLLLDDNNSSPARDRLLAALDAHPNIEVRLFNPFLHRRWHAVGYLTDFARLNRRMHNKSFTADNQVTIIGGRNVGDEYFGATQENTFVDLDALAVGPVVQEVSRDFDAYWACGSVYPADLFLPRLEPAAGAALAAELCQVEDQPAAQAYLEALARQPFVRDLLAGTLAFEWTTMRVVSDNPAKGLGEAPKASTLLPQLRETFGHPKSELQIVSPYFVPTKEGTQALSTLAGSGVRISVLTNSLAVTDVAPVHAGYAKWRKPLLRAGVSLYEMKQRTGTSKLEDRGLTGSSGSSLHAKTTAVDRSRVFIGSFNFDPRSALHNTEIGFVIDSPATARAIADMFAPRRADSVYEVRLDERGRVIWIEQQNGAPVIHHQEPNTRFWQRLSVTFLSWLPIDWLL